MTARRALLDRPARDAGIFEVLGGRAPLHPRNDTFPGAVFLRLAADAPEWCGAGRAGPLPLEGLRERFLPGATFRGRQDARLRYAVLAAAGVHGGTGPDLLDEAAWWQAGVQLSGPREPDLLRHDGAAGPGSEFGRARGAPVRGQPEDPQTAPGRPRDPAWPGSKRPCGLS